MAEAILFVGIQPANRPRTGRGLPRTKVGGEMLSWEDHCKPYPTLVTIRIVSRRVWIWESALACG